MKDALVIIDMQKGFVNEHTKHLIEKIVTFAKNNHFEMIIGTQYANHEKSPCYVFEGWKKCMVNSEEFQLVDEIDEICSDILIKDVYSCWQDSFRQYLVDNEIDRVVFVGVNTGCCVLHSAFDAYNDLFEIVVMEDLCGSTSGIESHNAAIRILKECITKERVLTTKQWTQQEQKEEEKKKKEKKKYCNVTLD